MSESFREKLEASEVFAARIELNESYLESSSIAVFIDGIALMLVGLTSNENALTKAKALILEVSFIEIISSHFGPTAKIEVDITPNSVLAVNCIGLIKKSDQSTTATFAINEQAAIGLATQICLDEHLSSILS